MSTRAATPIAAVNGANVPVGQRIGTSAPASISTSAPAGEDDERRDGEPVDRRPDERGADLGEHAPSSAAGLAARRTVGWR